MRNILLIVCAIGVVRVVRPLDAQNKIIGGQTAPAAVAPYMVSLRNQNTHYCAGSLIGSKTVVTAAHCLRGVAIQNLTIRAGSNSRLRGGTIVKVSRVKSHPFYNPSTSSYDLALIYLEQPLRLSRTIQPIRLYTGRLVTNTNVVIYGWGFQKENGRAVRNLRTATIKIYDITRCRRAYRRLLRRTMFCAGGVNPIRDSCDGDSGGPLVLKRRLAGVVSTGIGCGRRSSPGLYTNVPLLTRWIQTNS